jgi:hypothetical protein
LTRIKAALVACSKKEFNMQFQKRTSFEQVPIKVALKIARAELERTEVNPYSGGRMQKNPVCVECKDENDPVTPENGVWVPDKNGISVPVHNGCAAQQAIRSARTGTK